MVSDHKKSILRVKTTNERPESCIKQEILLYFNKRVIKPTRTLFAIRFILEAKYTDKKAF